MIREYWRDPHFWAWWWNSRVPYAAKIGIVTILVCGIGLGGYVGATGLSAVAGSTTGEELEVRTVQELVTIRRQARVVTRPGRVVTNKRVVTNERVVTNDRVFTRERVLTINGQPVTITRVVTETVPVEIRLTDTVRVTVPVTVTQIQTRTQEVPVTVTVTVTQP